MWNLIKRFFFLRLPIEQRRSLWMRGLLYAEEVGVQEATDQLYKHEFDDDCRDFDNGVYDYIKHEREQLGGNQR
jgi:hypothetical protein